MAIKVPLTREVPSGCDQDGKEIMDSTPVSMPLRKADPGNNLEQIVNKLLKARLGKAPSTVDDELEHDEDLPPTPYEYVYDEDLGQEIVRLEKKFLDAQRDAFDAIAKAKREASIHGKIVVDNPGDQPVSAPDKVAKSSGRANSRVRKDESGTEDSEG